ncbi:MAG: hypothetical protein ACR2MS_00445 [Weeksellaceae bacterium]
MALKIEPEFKEALLNLPEKEKDKYFLRLLKKDDILFHRLHFELVSEDTQDDRRNALEQDILHRIENSITRSANKIKSILRYISGDITYHVKTTNDKFGEPYLNTVMLIAALKQFNPAISKHYNFPIEKLNKYIAARIFKILTLVEKLHADDQFEFDALFEELADLIEKNNLLKEKLNDADFDYDWLYENNIPEDLNLHIRQVRSRGII